LLFTKKKAVAPVFKVVSAEFKDKLRFYVIVIPESSEVQSDTVDLQN
jgi:hypothetical protein